MIYYLSSAKSTIVSSTAVQSSEHLNIVIVAVGLRLQLKGQEGQLHEVVPGSFDVPIAVGPGFVRVVTVAGVGVQVLYRFGCC